MNGIRASEVAVSEDQGIYQGIYQTSRKDQQSGRFIIYRECSKYTVL